MSEENVRMTTSDGSWPLRDEAKERGCTCIWATEGMIEAFDPDCPIGPEHNGWGRILPGMSELPRDLPRDLPGG